jgi:hypothetical protein
MLKADLALLCLAACAALQIANVGDSSVNVETIATVPTWPWKANVSVPNTDAPGARR